MKYVGSIVTLARTVSVLAILSNPLCLQGENDNRPPVVSIDWPQSGKTFNERIKIKAQAADPDGSIAEVQFFANTNLIGVVTNPPFDVIWDARPHPPDELWELKAVAVDNSGAKAESAVTVGFVYGRPSGWILDISSPRPGALLAAPATFDFTAELLASTGESGPVEFYVGTNLVQRVDRDELFTAATAPYSIIVSNITEGTYTLFAKHVVDSRCIECEPITISVVKLGLQAPSVSENGHFQFDVVTASQNRPTIIQTSTNLRDWTSISTNVPNANSFHFVDLNPLNSKERFYRVMAAP